MADGETEHDSLNSDDGGDDSDSAFRTFLDRYNSERGTDMERPMSDYLDEFRRLAESWGSDAETLVPPGDGFSSTGVGVEAYGPYALVRELGRGGQGVVYLAEDTRSGRRVALKALTALGPAAQDHLQRFRREAKVCSRLNHPGICPVLDSGVSEKGPYIVLQFVDGDTLAQRIITSREVTVAANPDSEYMDIESAPSMTQQESRDDSSADLASIPLTRFSMERDELDGLLLLFEKVALALHAAHEAGIVHRDIKPGNIMVTEEEEPVILDFGLARDEESAEPTLTRTGDVFGTPAYMSPEQIAGGRGLDRRADIYSLGVSLYESVTLRRPFEGPTRQRMYLAIINQMPPDPSQINSGVNGDLRLVMATAMEKEARRRYQTAADFADDLRRVRLGLRVEARALPGAVRIARWARRNPVMASSIVGLFLTLSVGLGIALTLLGETRAQRNRAETERREAVAQRERADSSVAAYERLADVKRLSQLLTAEQVSWPPVPDSLGDDAGIEAWLEGAQAMEGNRPGHMASLCALRREALPEPDPILDADRAAKLRELEAALKPLLAGVADDAARARFEEVERALDDTPVSWRFSDETLGWRHDVLSELVRDISGLGSVRQRVQRQAAFIRSLGKLEARYEEAWEEVLEAISDRAENPRYRGFVMSPQSGLIPLGKDPESGLFEFVHAQTGEVPRRDAEGRAVVTPESGMVLVLLPPGAFTVGAQSADPGAAGYDPMARPMDARPNSGGVREVVVESPFFISKYEMTQGQWARLTGANPSFVKPGYGIAGGRRVGLDHPVEQVSWLDCRRVLPRMGLALPTEIEWEYACRGGSASPWWTGDEAATLRGAANVADSFYHRHGGVPSQPYEEQLDDGRTFHAPVGSYRGNGFGLHDTVGNVWEWCDDDYGNRGKIIRGGGFKTRADVGRSGSRNQGPIAFRDSTAGVRPVRHLDP